MSTLERRLSKLEDALLTPPMQAFCLLAEPQSDPAPGTWDEHRQQIEAAKARGDFVAIVSSARPGDRAHYDQGVTYYASAFEARLVEASRLPSRCGNRSLLSDVLASLSGNVIRPKRTHADSRQREGYASMHSPPMRTTLTRTNVPSRPR